MQIVSWRRKLWQERLASKKGIPISSLDGLPKSLYHYLRCKDVDTVDDLINFVEQKISERNFREIFSKQFYKIVAVLDKNYPDKNYLNYVLQVKVNLFFARKRHREELYKMCKRVKRDNLKIVKITRSSFNLLKAVSQMGDRRDNIT